jgi:hypothetical protein
MYNLKLSGLLVFAIIAITSCSSIPDRPWSDAIPENTPFVIIPEQDATLNSVLQSAYTPFLDDITSSANQLMSRVDSTASEPVKLKGIMLYTGADNQLETVWITQATRNFNQRMKNNFYQDFSQNEYYFHDVVINILHLGDRRLFTAQLHDNVLISESSLGIEDAIRAYIGELPRAQLDELSLEPGHLVMNTPSLEGWIKELTMVTHRPSIKNILRGTAPALLSVSQEGEDQNRTFHLSGTIPLSDKVPSELVASSSSSNAPITLDRYISSDAAAFGLFRLAPRQIPPTSLPDTTQLDSMLMESNVRYTNIAKTLNREFSLVMYAQSGFLSTGEHLFLRKVSDTSALRQELADLAADGHIEQRDGIYVIQSAAIAKLIGSSLCTFQNFYLDVTGDVVTISKRRGLVEIVTSDRNRRRTMFYEQSFRDIKDDLPEEISSLFVANPDFYSFIEPFLAPDSYLNALTSRFNILTASTSLNDDEESLVFNLHSYQTEDQTAPYREKWLFPTGSDLSGKPVMADIGGSVLDEVIFATKSGNVYTLAADGTVVIETNTGSDVPIGSPVVYDWYGNNQNVILLPAGNKIYGWDNNGRPLPQFPFELDEKITSSLVVNDVDQDGLPNALVATANRQLHILNGRGQNISGWPVTTNAEINTKPVVENYQGSNSVIAFSENAVHAWSADGTEREGFPKFINATLSGSPVVYEGNILGNATDGYLYSIGPQKLFADSLSVYETTSESSQTEAIYVSNSTLEGSPSVQELTVRDEEATFSEPMILTMSSNGSIFLISMSGQLRFTQNMGQPAATSFSPFVSDINQNNQDDIIALANFGRLYVWEINNSEQIYSVPTSAMQYPIITDIDGDGYNELIAQTQEGLRTWTIYGEKTTSE